MTPTDRLVTRFAAEPPQDKLPYGRWAERLQEELLAAFLRIDSEGEDLGDPGDVVWHPDRTWDGRTYVPATCRTTTGLELFGYVSFAPATEEDDPSDFFATADFTDELAENNPDWRLDVNDEVIGGWRGENGSVAAMTLVWGRPVVAGGVVVTAELADLAVDQCTLVEDRFTLVAPDDYRGDTLDVKLWDGRGDRIAAESLYE